VTDFWTNLLQNDRNAMAKVDSATVEELQLRAPQTSRSDAVHIFRKLKEGEIFSSFSLDYRMKIWTKLQTFEGLIPTLFTFFEDFKYFQSCAECVKKLVKIPRKGTLYQAMTEIFSQDEMGGSECITQESESIFRSDKYDFAVRVDWHYRQIFLYVMRHLRELSPTSVLKTDRNPRLTKTPSKAALYGLADLAQRMGFESDKIRNLKRDYLSYRLSDELSESTTEEASFVVRGEGETKKRRRGRTFEDAHEQSKAFIFPDVMHRLHDIQGTGVSALFVRKSVYQAFFGIPIYLQNRNLGVARMSRPARPEINELSGTGEIVPKNSEPVASSTSAQNASRNEQELPPASNQHGPSRLNSYLQVVEEVHSLVNPHQESADLGECSVEEEAEWPVQQKNHPPDIPNILQETMGPGSEESIMEQISLDASIITSNFYLEEDDLDLDFDEGEISRDAATTGMAISAEGRPNSSNTEGQSLALEQRVGEVRIDFILYNGHEWTKVETCVANPAYFGHVTDTAKAHINKGRRLFDAKLQAVAPSECFRAAIFTSLHAILLIPAGIDRICTQLDYALQVWQQRVS
jgi:hypothetical protein